MTFVRYKGRAGKRKPPTVIPNPLKKEAQRLLGFETPARVGHVPIDRIKEIKRVSRAMPEEDRIKRLVKLAHEHGPEKLKREIEIHERKIAELTVALATYAADTKT